MGQVGDRATAPGARHAHSDTAASTLRKSAR
jgi:hypothetical protein